MSHGPSDNLAVERWEVQVRKGVLELVVLAAFWSGRLYGLELIRRLESDAKLAVAEGTLYPLLSRLHVDGQLEAEWVEADAGHPRKYYKLTPEGRRRVVKMTRFWREFTSNIDEILAPVLPEYKR
ncbi:MAG TPA: helix-turn-helix transcriptional regulator [Steroidobacteraceae bacterium]